MVGKLGCGCCASGCCSSGTTTWIEPFSSTPSGQPYDTITNITGPNCRATCPPPSTVVGYGVQYLKTSTLQIDADSQSPMYLGLNGFPTGAKFEAGWISSTNASQWELMIPPLRLEPTVMGIAIQSELIFKFQTFTFYSGSSHSFDKRVNRNIFGQLVYEYRAQSQGYFRVDNGPNIPEYTRFWFSPFGGPRFLDWDIRNFYQPDNTAVGVNKCYRIYQEKNARENTSGEPLRSLTDPNYIPKGTLPALGIFQCYVGWKSTVSWYTSTAFGALGTGAFDFKSEYVSWKPAAWMPYMP